MLRYWDQGFVMAISSLLGPLVLLLANDYCCIFGVVGMLQTKFWNWSDIRSACTCVSTEKNISSDQIQIKYFQGTSTLLHCCLLTHILVALFLQVFSKHAAFCKSQTLHILTHQSRASAANVLHLSAEFSGFFGCKSSTKSISDQTFPECRWVVQSPTSFCQVWDYSAAGLLIAKTYQSDESFIMLRSFLLVYGPQRFRNI